MYYSGNHSDTNHVAKAYYSYRQMKIPGVNPQSKNKAVIQNSLSRRSSIMNRVDTFLLEGCCHPLFQNFVKEIFLLMIVITRIEL
jgi:hypothetical protein